MRKSLLAVTLFTFAVGGSTACASKGFVKTQVGQVSSKVDTLSQSLEETQERTRKNETRINDVDGKAQNAQNSANQAQQAASTADGKAVAADGKAVAAGEAARMAAMRAEEVEKATRKLLYTVVLSEEQGNFKFNQALLPDATKAKIDELINQIKADPKGAYFEIEGHTDNVGDKVVNERVGLNRAEAVKRYLYEQHQIPLHRMNIISYGEDKPVAPNNTRDGRAQNRRVVIKVLI
jgi:outer membrane protein OmpA-like peptidoglycan-associated protein